MSESNDFIVILVIKIIKYMKKLRKKLDKTGI